MAGPRSACLRPVSFLLLVLTGLLLAGPIPSELFRAGAGAASRAPSPQRLHVETSRGTLELRVYAPASSDEGEPPVLFLSGEGGWRRFDEGLAAHARAAGFWVGGFDCWSYFWKPQDDRDALARDIRACADALARAAGRPPGAPFILAGYSFGADLVPWIAGGADWGGRLRGLLMIGPDLTGSLEVRISELLGFRPSTHVFSVSDALRSAAGVPVVLVHASKDDSSDAPALAAVASDPKKLIVVEGGSHHFSGAERGLEEAVAGGLGWLLATGR